VSARLSTAYGSDFEAMLATVAAAGAAPETPLVPFWPLAGAAYDGELLVIGRSVNGWIEDWTPGQLADPGVRATAVERLRRDAEPKDRCRMAWVTDLWAHAPATTPPVQRSGGSNEGWMGGERV